MCEKEAGLNHSVACVSRERKLLEHQDQEHTQVCEREAGQKSFGSWVFRERKLLERQEHTHTSVCERIIFEDLHRVHQTGLDPVSVLLIARTHLIFLLKRLSITFCVLKVF